MVELSNAELVQAHMVLSACTGTVAGKPYQAAVFRASNIASAELNRRQAVFLKHKGLTQEFLQADPRQLEPMTKEQLESYIKQRTSGRP